MARTNGSRHCWRLTTGSGRKGATGDQSTWVQHEAWVSSSPSSTAAVCVVCWQRLVKWIVKSRCRGTLAAVRGSTLADPVRTRTGPHVQVKLHSNVTIRHGLIHRTPPTLLVPTIAAPRHEGIQTIYHAITNRKVKETGHKDRRNVVTWISLTC